MAAGDGALQEGAEVMSGDGIQKASGFISNVVQLRKIVVKELQIIIIKQRTIDAYT